MRNKITESTAAHSLGLAGGRKLLKVPSGQYEGRMAALIHNTPSTIVICWADRPYATWSSPETVVADAADQPFDCLMDADGNIHIVYSEDSTAYMVARKLTMSAGVWSSEAKVTVYNGDESFFPTLAVDNTGRLHVSWSRKTGSFYYLHVKSSDDGGETWGSGPSDGGDFPAGGSSSLFSRMGIGPADLHVIYTHAGDTLSHRSRPLSGGDWSTETYLATCSGQYDSDFDVAVSADGLIGVLFDQEALKYREYDGAAWGPVIALDETEALSPQLLFKGNVPVAVYLTEKGSGQHQLMFTSRHTGSFDEPAPLDPSAKPFDSVLLYHASTATYADATAEAASSTAADVYHPESGALVQQEGDSVYLGMDTRFRFAKVLLSTAGSGGTVTYSYWDGSNWQAFTPTGGTYDLDASGHDLLLWTDYASMPSDWQKSTIDGTLHFWIRVEVVSPFSTGPVGSQVTALSSIGSVIVRR